MPCSTLPQVEATRLHARHREIHEQVLALEDLRPVAIDLWNSTGFFTLRSRMRVSKSRSAAACWTR